MAFIYANIVYFYYNDIASLKEKKMLTLAHLTLGYIGPNMIIEVLAVKS